MASSTDGDPERVRDTDLQDLVSSTDSGARTPHNPIALRILIGGALCWSLFQLWYASPLPFILGVGIFNDAEARAIHLGFAAVLAFLAFPSLAHGQAARGAVPKIVLALVPAILLAMVLGFGQVALSAAVLGVGTLIVWSLLRPDRSLIPLPDWALAIAAGVFLSYRFWAYDALAARPGLPTEADLILSLAGLVLLLEATRRVLGPPLMVVALVFLVYIFFGSAEWVPDTIQWAGASVSKAMSHLMLGDQGVYGIAVGVSTKFVFLFVLFGALLERAGAGNYFIQVAFSLLGHMRGGPAKAAVVASGMTGLISGSSIANVVTTGTFTVPLMKRVGFTSEKAGAVEVASSVNGQIMPPVMGAAAFLMVEYIGIPYFEVVKHAFLPAVISYIALIYIVHLEALKQGMQGLEKRETKPWYLSLLTGGIVISSIIILMGVIYFAIGWIKPTFGAAAPWIVAVLVAGAYVGLLWYGSRYPLLSLDDPDRPIDRLPPVGPTVKSGLHFLLPIVVLVWCLMVERMSPGLSAFWASAFMIFILLTQRPLTALFRRTGHGLGGEARAGAVDLFEALVTGARNMIGIGIATATAGIIVGTVTLTGIGLVLAQFVEFLSGGNLIVMLILVAVLSLVLGMGLPTTANYIVVSALMAPVIVEVGSASGLIVPLIAVHLFVFYFGIMADVTPPVGLASFAAAAVSGGDPLKTGFTAFFYSLRTVALPFMFIFNTELILYDLDGWPHLVGTVVTATIAMLVFAAATQAWFLTRCRWYEVIALLLVAFTLFRPGFWMDMAFPPTDRLPGSQAYELAEQVPPGGTLRIVLEGEDFDTLQPVTRSILLPLGEGETGRQRIEAAGLELREAEGGPIVDFVAFGSPAQDLGIDFDFQITAVIVDNAVPAKEWAWIPALLLLGGIVVVQRRRIRHDGTDQPGTATAVAGR